MMNTRTSMAVASAFTLVVALVPAQTRAQTALGDAREFYDGVDSIYMRASVDVAIESPLFEGHDAPVRGVGFIEHWEQGDRFRTRVWIDPKLGLMTNLEVAFDGEHYQMYLLDTKTLANERPLVLPGQLMQVPTPVPNPFYLPIKYLAPSDDVCPACQLTLAFVKRNEVWSKVPPSMPIDSAIVDVAGGERAGEGYNHRVYSASAGIEAEAGTMGGLERIDRVGIDTLVQDSVVFSQFEDGFPHRIRLSSYEPQKDPPQTVVVVDYQVEELVLNSVIGDTVFTIAAEEGSAVWDGGTPVRPGSN